MVAEKVFGVETTNGSFVYAFGYRCICRQRATKPTSRVSSVSLATYNLHVGCIKVQFWGAHYHLSWVCISFHRQKAQNLIKLCPERRRFLTRCILSSNPVYGSVACLQLTGTVIYTRFKTAWCATNIE